MKSFLNDSREIESVFCGENGLWVGHTAGNSGKISRIEIYTERFGDLEVPWVAFFVGETIYSRWDLRGCQIYYKIDL